MDTHADRVRRAALLHRSPDYEEQMEELLRGDASQVRLGLVAAAHAGRWGRLIQALEHPSLGVRELAVGLLPRDPRAARAAAGHLEALAPALRRRVLDLVRNTGLADEWLTRVDPPSAGRLLPGCSAETVAARLPDLHPYVNWKWMARAHPAATLAWMRRDLEEVDLRWRPWWRYVRATEELVRTHPLEVLALVRDLSDPESFPLGFEPRLKALARRHPDEVFALLHRDRVDWSLAGAFSPEQQEELASWTVPENPGALATVLEKVPVWERGRVFQAAARGHAPVWPTMVLDLLPGELRDREAARMLEMREVQHGDRLRILARRSWAAAKEELLAETRRSQAEERAQGWRLLVLCAGLDSGEAVTEAVRLLAERLRNEQDPVRQAAAEALAGVPMRHLRYGQPDLDPFVTAVFEARDTSHATTSALARLAMRLLQGDAHVDAALRILERHVARSGSLHGLAGLPRALEDRVLEPLLRWMERLARLEQHALALAVAGALKRRAWRHAALQAILGEIALRGDSWSARTAIAFWLGDPAARDERVERLLAEDPSSVAVWSVWLHLHLRRQDLLGRFLDAPVLKGRFLTGATRWLPTVPPSGLWRWRFEDMRTLAGHLEDVAADEARTSSERASALAGRGRLPVTTAADLARFVASPEVTVAEAALGALASLDRPEEALPVLLQWLDGDRARVAAYALARVLRGVSPSQAVAAVEDLLARPRLKVTVEKEAVRLLGTLRAPGAGRVLRSRWDRPDLHRDVRIAVLHAAKALRDEESWALLAEGAASAEADVARSVLQFAPAGVPRTEAVRYLDLVRQVCRGSSLEVRKAAYAALAAWAFVAPEPVGQAAAEAVLDLGFPHWRAALSALVSSEASVCAQLASQPADPEAEAERDRPARQRLAAVVGALVSRRPPAPAALLRRIAGSVPPVEAARLRAAALDWTDPPAAGSQLVHLLEGTHRAAWEAARGEVLAGVARVRDAAALLPALEALSAGPPPARWMALTLLASLGPRAGWPDDWRALLRRLREDAHPGVAEEAGRIWTAGE